MKKMMYAITIMCGLTFAGSVMNEVNAQVPGAYHGKKKGWSKKAKYSAIGAGAGAVTGVAVSKNNSKGAVIGGAVGAGSGYLYGRHKDRKAGRKSAYKH